jgi:hypothetical protein
MKIWFLAIYVILLCINISAQDIGRLAKTPPMGWNSWNCFGMDVTEDQIKATADYMAENLKEYGWEYIVLDMGWNYGEGLNTSNFRIPDPPQCIDAYGRLIPNVGKFPSSVNGKGLKELADYVHGKGLKFGIHIMRGIPWQAVEKDMPVYGTNYRAGDITTEEDACRWFHGLVTVDMSKPGAQEYYNSIVQMYAEWGVDYIKADDMLGKAPRFKEIEAVAKAINKAGRPIVLSLSAGPLPVDNIDKLRQNANLWRISGDMWDDWQYIEETFKLCRQWQDYVTPGHWPDCDMLALGKLRINGTDGALAKRIIIPKEKTLNEYSRFTDDEKYTHFTLWSIFRSPLMMGGDLMQLDEISSSLLTNKEVLAVNQKSINNHELRFAENEIVWVADDPVSGGKYFAIFNLNGSDGRNIEITRKELGISGKFKVRDLWKREDAGKLMKSFKTEIPPHGCGLYKVSRK